MSELSTLRDRIAELHAAPEDAALDALIARAAPDTATRTRACARGADLVARLRADADPGLMEVFLAEYGLSTREGIALMCLAEALLRVPDTDTIDALIEDKIAPSEWGAHLGHSSSVLVNASTWALMLTGKVLQDDDDGGGMAHVLRGALRRLGEPVIRAAVGRAMREMGRQFVLGETIASAMARAAAMEAKGYTYSYDMLGEAALTEADADAFYAAYQDAIAALGDRARSADIRDNPGISIKLSALHPRYEEAQRHRLAELTHRVGALAREARAAGIGLNIDAEEAERLEISLDVIEAVLADPGLAGWDGFGVVIQGYSKRCPALIDWLGAIAARHDRRLMVRLVKGAYWDREIKRAQVEGLATFPVYTRKCATDAAYLCCARLLLDQSERLYPQFATHNAHTVAAILEMAGNRPFEFQRLHGMGERLHDIVLAEAGTRCRIYAPVGAHRDLLAYLVRRLLENGANSSFVNQVMDPDVPVAEIAADPFEVLEDAGANLAVTPPAHLFAPERVNSRGWDLMDRADLAAAEAARDGHAGAVWTAGAGFSGPNRAITNPADPDDTVGHVTEASADEARAAIAAAQPWDAPAADRAAILTQAADLFEADHGALFSLLTREAGKTLTDAVAELREAVDFLRYYAAGAPSLTDPALGRIACISPWNFPLAIFTGQLAAGLAAGNAVLAKPAEDTPLIAARAVALLQKAGVPAAALTLLPGQGDSVGAALTQDPKVNGVVFTGSTSTAQIIHRAMADHLDPAAPLIAETGGINAMIVDSTALPEQAVLDIVTSAFRSAGQRCSALRMLYVQEDVADPLLRMLRGAMDELVLGDPADRATDVGPVITATAAEDIARHVARYDAAGRVQHQIPRPERPGHFVPPVLLDQPGGIGALDREVFGPVLHVTTFKAEDLDRVIAEINARGFGLTFALHSRIDDRVQSVAGKVRAGNTYVNRNQIGAIVGSQPFGGEGRSGTGPKAGGPHYLPRFCRAAQGQVAQDAARQTPGGTQTLNTPQRPDAPQMSGAPQTSHLPDTPDAPQTPNVPQASFRPLSDALAALPDPDGRARTGTDLPGPTGEANRLTTHPRGRVLCLGPGPAAAAAQVTAAQAVGCSALAHGGPLDPAALTDAAPLDAVLWWGDAATARRLRQALARRAGAIIPLITAADPSAFLVLERHLCIDTTAAGGNATLLAAAS